jgi:hypothetical protein
MGEGASRFWSLYSASRPPRGGGRQEEGNGSASAAPGQGAAEHECLEWCPICRGAEVVRATTPPELREQWNSVQRDVLLMMRSLIEAYLVRMGTQGHTHAHEAERSVQDIPIE